MQKSTRIALPLEFRGEDTDIQEKLDIALSQSSENPEVEFVLDAAQTKYINSSGIGILLKHLKKVQSMDGRMVIRNLHGDPLTLFRSTGLDMVFTVEEPEDTAPTTDNLPLVVQFNSHGNIGIFRLSGTMQSSAAIAAFKEKVLLELADKSKILLDLCQLDEINPFAAREIVNIHRILDSSDEEMRLSRARPNVLSVLNESGLPESVEAFDSEEDALVNWD